eukprot:6312140-Pyramimonas_sp.AAC.1
MTDFAGPPTSMNTRASRLREQSSFPVRSATPLRESIRSAGGVKARRWRKTRTTREDKEH